MVWKKIHLTEGNTKGEDRSKPQSKPSKSEGTIIDDFLKLKELIDKHHRLKRGGYE